MRRPITAERVSLKVNFIQMATGLLMVTQQLDATDVSEVAIYVVQQENRKWPTAQNRILSAHHHFHIPWWTVSGHDTLTKAGEKSKGMEPHSLVSHATYIH